MKLDLFSKNWSMDWTVFRQKSYLVGSDGDFYPLEVRDGGCLRDGFCSEYPIPLPQAGSILGQHIKFY